jgi:hypothetical protein
MLQPGQAQVNAGYTPVQNFIKSLSSVSPGTTGNYAQTGSNTGTIAGTNSSSGDTTSVGAKGK